MDGWAWATLIALQPFFEWRGMKKKLKHTSIDCKLSYQSLTFKTRCNFHKHSLPKAGCKHNQDSIDKTILIKRQTNKQTITACRSLINYITTGMDCHCIHNKTHKVPHKMWQECADKILLNNILFLSFMCCFQ